MEILKEIKARDFQVKCDYYLRQVKNLRWHWELKHKEGVLPDMDECFVDSLIDIYRIQIKFYRLYYDGIFSENLENLEIELNGIKEKIIHLEWSYYQRCEGSEAVKLSEVNEPIAHDIGGFQKIYSVADKLVRDIINDRTKINFDPMLIEFGNKIGFSVEKHISNLICFPHASEVEYLDSWILFGHELGHLIWNFNEDLIKNICLVSDIFEETGKQLKDKNISSPIIEFTEKEQIETIPLLGKILIKNKETLEKCEHEPLIEQKKAICKIIWAIIDEIKNYKKEKIKNRSKNNSKKILSDERIIANFLYELEKLLDIITLIGKINRINEKNLKNIKNLRKYKKNWDKLKKSLSSYDSLITSQILQILDTMVKTPTSHKKCGITIGEKIEISKICVSARVEEIFCDILATLLFEKNFLKTFIYRVYPPKSDLIIDYYLPPPIRIKMCCKVLEKIGIKSDAFEEIKNIEYADTYNLSEKVEIPTKLINDTVDLIYKTVLSKGVPKNKNSSFEIFKSNYEEFYKDLDKTKNKKELIGAEHKMYRKFNNTMLKMLGLL